MGCAVLRTAKGANERRGHQARDSAQPSPGGRTDCPDYARRRERRPPLIPSRINLPASLGKEVPMQQARPHRHGGKARSGRPFIRRRGPSRADRRSYPRASISLPAWAKKCRCSKRALIDTVAKLVQDGHLFIVEDHRAQTATLYEIPVRGVKISKPLEVKVSAPLYREEPLERTSRADLQCTAHSAPTGLQATNVIPIRLLKRREA